LHFALAVVVGVVGVVYLKFSEISHQQREKILLFARFYIQFTRAGNMKDEARGQRLAAFRRAKKLTGLQLAAELGVTSGGMSGYEKGDSFPSVDKLEKLARLGLNLNWYVTGEGPMLVDGENPAPAGKELLDLVARVTRLEMLASLVVPPSGAGAGAEAGAAETVKATIRPQKNGGAAISTRKRD
jgi:transcriptional regulator with XRE-family HTH domain